MSRSSQENNNSFEQYLTEDDKAKLRLLALDDWSRSRTENVSCQQLFSSSAKFEEYWSEALFLIQRYDLLKSLNLCEVKVSSRLENKDNHIYFQPNSRGRVLLDIYNEITTKMETDFDTAFEAKRHELFDSQINQRISHGQISLNLAGKLLLCTDTNKSDKLSKIFSALDWNALVKKIDEIKPSMIQAEAFPLNYPMDKSPCGKCIIINNRNVNGLQERKGSEKDVSAMDTAFQNFNFIVDIHMDLTAKAMRDVLKETASSDHKQYNAFVCVIMSHGDEGVVRSSDDELLSYDQIADMFKGSECPSLIGKPKLFFFQACQGESLQCVLPNFTFPLNSEFALDGPVRSVPLVDRISDHLVAAATQPGCGAIRLPCYGSWFIQALAKAFEKCDNLHDAELQAKTLVSTNSVLVNGRQRATQNPIWTSTLKRNVIFRRK